MSVYLVSLLVPSYLIFLLTFALSTGRAPRHSTSLSIGVIDPAFPHPRNFARQSSRGRRAPFPKGIPPAFDEGDGFKSIERDGNLYACTLKLADELAASLFARPAGDQLFSLSISPIALKQHRSPLLDRAIAMSFLAQRIFTTIRMSRTWSTSTAVA